MEVARIFSIYQLLGYGIEADAANIGITASRISVW
jgi:hypothetical protein